MLCVSFVLFFFFKQKTAYEMRISDWSSDVCSSDLLSTRSEGGARPAASGGARRRRRPRAGAECRRIGRHDRGGAPAAELRSRQCEGEARAREIGRASCRERVCQYV